MGNPIHILLQTTIPNVADDWNIDRFSLLRDHLALLGCYKVTTRNREANAEGDDKVLSVLDTTDVDELWLFAVDTGDGLSKADCEGITRFHQRGGGILATRDHQDLGSSLCTLGGVGRAHFFHTQHQEPDESRRARDDQDNTMISWPNYHSGANGDYQSVTVVEPVHELLRGPSGVIQYFPAHPHEGSVGVPENEDRARVIATGVSQASGRDFNLVVAFEYRDDRHGNRLGRAVAESSFHHFVDYNWDTSKGGPSFLSEPPGDEIKRDPERLSGIKNYVTNLARWLAPVLLLAFVFTATQAQQKSEVVNASDGVPIYYSVQGKGEPALVFIHCWSCNRHYWDNQVAEFSKTYRVVTIDLPGHGESGQGRKSWSVESYGDDVKTVVTKLNLKRVVLVGSSMGGPIALEATRRMQDRVVAIVPVDTLQNVDQKVPQEQLDAVFKQMEADFKGASTSLLNQFFFSPTTPAAVKERVINDTISRPPDVALPILKGVFSYDAAAGIKEVKVPIRAINADRVPTDVAANRKYAPQFDAVIIKGTGHYPMLEDPARFNQMLAEILRNLPRQ